MALLGESVLVSRTLDGGVPVWPVTLKHVKDNAQIDHDEDDHLLLSPDGLDGIIPQAVDYIERRARHALITQTRKLYLPGSVFSKRNEIEVPFPPLLTVSEFKYLDSNYATQTVSSALYRVVTNSNRVVLKSGCSWPSACLDEATIWLTYTCGFGSSAADIPPAWKRAVMSLCSYWWTHRAGQPGGQFGRDVDAGFQKAFDRVLDVAGGMGRYV